MFKLEKITILGKTYPVVFPKDPAEDFKIFMEIFNKTRKTDDQIDFLEILEEFGAYLFIKYNKDLFVKMMVEETINIRGDRLKHWFERNMPL